MLWNRHIHNRGQEGLGETCSVLRTQRVDNREDKRWGASSAAQWQKLFTIARQEKLIQGTFDVKDAFTGSLIDDVNRFDAQAVIRQAREYR